MSADNIEAKDPGPKPTWFAELDIGPGVLVFVERDYVGEGQYSRTLLDLTYKGYEDDLLSAGVITAAMLIPPGKGHHYRDANGRNVRISRRWRAQYGNPLPAPYLKVTRHMDIEELHRWPRGRQSLAAYDNYRAWERAFSAFLRGGGRPAENSATQVPPERPALRLVIDNTRREV